MMKFVKVTDPIKEISTKEVTFDTSDAQRPYIDSETCIQRVHNKKIIWSLRKDGLYVRREYAVAYKLSFE